MSEVLLVRNLHYWTLGNLCSILLLDVVARWVKGRCQMSTSLPKLTNMMLLNVLPPIIKPPLSVFLTMQPSSLISRTLGLIWHRSCDSHLPECGGSEMGLIYIKVRISYEQNSTTRTEAFTPKVNTHVLNNVFIIMDVWNYYTYMKILVAVNHSFINMKYLSFRVVKFCDTQSKESSELDWLN